MKKSRAFKLQTTPYAVNLRVLVASPEVGRRWLKRHGHDIELAGNLGITHWVEDDPDIFVWLEVGDLGDVVHEMTHCAMRILKNCGVVVTPLQDEPLAYLLESLVTQCMKKIKR